MALVYTEEQKELIAMVKEMAEKEVKPHVAECDRTGNCPIELFDPALEMGLHLAEIPEEYGGMGLSFETTAMMYEELAKVDAGYADTLVTAFVAFQRYARRVHLSRSSTLLTSFRKANSHASRSQSPTQVPMPAPSRLPL